MSKNETEKANGDVITNLRECEAFELTRRSPVSSGFVLQNNQKFQSVIRVIFIMFEHLSEAVSDLRFGNKFFPRLEVFRFLEVYTAKAPGYLNPALFTIIEILGGP